MVSERSDCESSSIFIRGLPVALPILADYIWVGGGTLGLILIIVVVVLLLRR
jgi:hypothetical protein